MRTNPIYFIIGTRAQFIKVAPILRKLLDRQIPYQLLFTAQHRENITEILNTYRLPVPDKTLYHADEASTRSSFLRWFSSIFFKVVFQAKTYLPEPGIVLTHGDTFTAWLAAVMGKMSGSKVAHIESGLRSFNIFSPFPEELSRLITFTFSDIYFCSSQWAVDNLKNFRGLKVNLGANTLLDGVRFAVNFRNQVAYDFLNEPYAMVAIHRYENIFSKRLENFIIPCLEEISMNNKLIFVLHPSTRERLLELDLHRRLEMNKDIQLYERFSFVEWIQLCQDAEFVITDGGSNQEEMSYLGTPTLLFRNETERKEGLGDNVVLSRFNRDIIFDFVSNPREYRTNPNLEDICPSDRIIEIILDQ